jgi:hypothetical protein
LPPTERLEERITKLEQQLYQQKNIVVSKSQTTINTIKPKEKGKNKKTNKNTTKKDEENENAENSDAENEESDEQEEEYVERAEDEELEDEEFEPTPKTFRKPAKQNSKQRKVTKSTSPLEVDHSHKPIQQKGKNQQQQQKKASQEISPSLIQNSQSNEAVLIKKSSIEHIQTIQTIDCAMVETNMPVKEQTQTQPPIIRSFEIDQKILNILNAGEMNQLTKFAEIGKKRAQVLIDYRSFKPLTEVWCLFIYYYFSVLFLFYFVSVCFFSWNN